VASAPAAAKLGMPPGLPTKRNKVLLVPMAQQTRGRGMTARLHPVHNPAPCGPMACASLHRCFKNASMTFLHTTLL